MAFMRSITTSKVKIDNGKLKSRDDSGFFCLCEILWVHAEVCALALKANKISGIFFFERKLCS